MSEPVVCIYLYLVTLATVNAVCVPPEYFRLDENDCHKECPYGFYGEKTAAACQQWPPNFDVINNASAYYLSIQEDTALSTVILNYTIVLDEAVVGQPQNIFLSLSSSDLVHRILSFDNGETVKSYSEESLPEEYMKVNDIAFFQEQISITSSISDTLLNSLLSLSLSTEVNSVYRFESTVYLVIYNSSDVCESNPCKNGNCNATFDELACICHPAYNGFFCETLFNPCALDLCRNGASCENIGSVNFRCICSNEFTGRNCETKIDHCLLSPGACNNGTCVDGVGELSCECFSGFTGVFCETDINECETVGCVNGECIHLINNFTCDCYQGWTGQRCETDINYCLLDHTLFGPCDDIGSVNCIDGNSTFSCICHPDYSGYTCDINIPMCRSNPCFNGNCTNTSSGAFSCQCMPDYTGHDCGISLFPCNNRPCFNNGTCVDSESGLYTCDCSMEYTGQNCEIEIVCRAEYYLGYSWPETVLGTTARAPCLCEQILGGFAGHVERLCTETLSQGAEWSMELNDSNCVTSLSEISRELCHITLMLEGAQNETDLRLAAKKTTMITSTPQRLKFNDITLATYIVEKLTEEAAIDSEVRGNYLQTVDNLQLAESKEVKKSRDVANSTTKILNSLESFIDNTEFENQTIYTFTSFAIQMYKFNIKDFKGHTFLVNLGPVESAKNISTRMNTSITFNNVVGRDPTKKEVEKSTASLQLHKIFSEEINSSCSQMPQQKLSFTVFLTDSLFFPDKENNTTLGSVVVHLRASQLENKTNITINFDTFDFPEQEENTNITKSCGIHKRKDNFGAWNRGGCRKVAVSKEGLVTCDCTQFGHFGILFDLNPTTVPMNFSIALAVVTFIGLAVSMLCLWIFILTCICSKKLRGKTHNHILVHMSVSLMCLYTIFLAGGFATNTQYLCGIVSALLQYFLLVFFSWTAVEAIWLLLKLVTVLESQSLTKRYLLKAGLPAWLLPMVVVSISVGAGHEYYTSDYYCRPTEWPFYFGFMLPFLLIYTLNWISFCVIMTSLCKCTSRASKVKFSTEKTRSLKKNFVIAMSLAVVLGFGWGIGLAVTSSDLVELTFTLQLIFSVFVGSQGVLIFALHGLRNAVFRKFWAKILLKSCKKNSVNKQLSKRNATTSQEVQTMQVLTIDPIVSNTNIASE